MLKTASGLGSGTVVSSVGFNSSYAPLTVAAIGDSFVSKMTTTDLNGGSTVPTPTTIQNSYLNGTNAGTMGAHTMFSPLLHGALRSGYAWSMFEYTAGCSGATSATICDPANSVSCLNALYGFQTYLKNTFGLSTSYGKPDMCLVLAGTNDFGSFISISQTLANIEKAYVSLLSNNIIPIAWTVTPNQLAPTQIQSLNQGIIRLAVKYNLPLCDAYSAVASGSTGLWASTTYQFGTNDLHLSAIGAGLVGYALNQGIIAYLRQENRLVSVTSDIGSVASLTKTNSGSGYTNGSYYNVSLTGGTGSGAKGTIDIIGGSVATVDINYGGTGYVNGDVLSVAAGSVGGTGSGFTATVTTNINYNLDPNFTNFAGTINTVSSYSNQWDTPGTTAMSTIISPSTGTENGTGKTPYVPTPAILAGLNAQNYCGNAWQLKGDGTHTYNGGSYNVVTNTGDRMLLRFQVKWQPNLANGTLADFRLACWNNSGSYTGLSGIAQSSFVSKNMTCPIGGETNYPAGQFYQIFTIRSGGNKFANFLRLDFGNTSGIFSPPSATDYLTIANVQLINLTQQGLA